MGHYHRYSLPEKYFVFFRRWQKKAYIILQARASRGELLEGIPTQKIIEFALFRCAFKIKEAKAFFNISNRKAHSIATKLKNEGVLIKDTANKNTLIVNPELLTEEIEGYEPGNGDIGIQIKPLS